MNLRNALGEYERFYEGQVAAVEALVVEKPADSEKQLADIRRNIEHETNYEHGKLHSMSDDMKQAQKRKPRQLTRHGMH